LPKNFCDAKIFSNIGGRNKIEKYKKKKKFRQVDEKKVSGFFI
jgi:hypothetical protein